MELSSERFSRINANLTEKDFKTEWSHIETAGVKALLQEVMEEEFEVADDVNHLFQLAFTSSGRFTELSVATPDHSIEGNELNCFIIRNNNQLIAHCFDEQENDLFYEVR